MSDPRPEVRRPKIGEIAVLAPGRFSGTMQRILLAIICRDHFLSALTLRRHSAIFWRLVKYLNRCKGNLAHLVAISALVVGHCAHSFLCCSKAHAAYVPIWSLCLKPTFFRL